MVLPSADEAWQAGVGELRKDVVQRVGLFSSVVDVKDVGEDFGFVFLHHWSGGVELVDHVRESAQPACFLQELQGPLVRKRQFCSPDPTFWYPQEGGSAVVIQPFF